MTCEGTKHRFNLSRLADNDAPWLCECGAVEWMEENGNLDCVSLDLEKVLRMAQELHVADFATEVSDCVGRAHFVEIPGGLKLQEISFRHKTPEVKPDHLIEPTKE